MKRGQISTVSRSGIASVLACVAFAGTAVAASHSPVSPALAATESVMVATALSEQAVVIAGGGLLFGLGISVVVSSVVTYKYKHNQIRSRFE